MPLAHRLGFMVVVLSLLAASGCGEPGGDADDLQALEDSTPSLDVEIPAAPSTPPALPETAVAQADATQQTAAAEPEAPAQSAATAGAPIEAGWGHLRGRFVYDGDPPQPQPVNVTKDQEYCGKFNLVDQSLVVNQDNGGIANVIIWLEPDRGQTVEAHPSYEAAAKTEVVLDNEQCRFEPHICVVRTGQTLKITNSDPVGHNTKVDMLSNASFNDNLPTGAALTKQVSNPERYPGLVSCSIHPWMRGRLVVKDHPYVAVTDKDGNFVIENLPEGEWVFHAYHDKSGNVDQVVLDGKQVDWRAGKFTQAIKSAVNDLGEVKVPAAVFEN